MDRTVRLICEIHVGVSGKRRHIVVELANRAATRVRSQACALCLEIHLLHDCGRSYTNSTENESISAEIPTEALVQFKMKLRSTWFCRSNDVVELHHVPT